MVILTQVVRKLEMYRILNRSRLWGPLGTVVFTMVYHYGVVQGWYEVSLALIFLFVAAGAFVSGLRGGLAAAVWGSAYGWYVMLPGSRLAENIIGMIFLAGLVGYGTRRLRRSIIDEVMARRVAEKNRTKAEIFDSLTNGNIRIFLAALDVLDGLRLGWEQIPDETRQKMVTEARAKLADLVTLAKGFEEMARQRGYVEEHERQ